MKLKEIILKNHFMFGDNNIKFTDKNGKILNTVIIAGVNGSGKTTFLKTIFDIITNENNEIPDSKTIISFENDEEINFFRRITGCQIEGNEPFNIKISEKALFPKCLYKAEEKYLPKIVYLPTEINFPEMEFKEDNLKKQSFFGITLTEKFFKDIPSFITTKFRKEIFKNKNLTVGENIDKVCNEINGIFDCLKIDVKLTGISEDDNMIPVFKNRYDNVVDINSLSSGEKQIFIRVLSLKMLDINNSVVLIDEPEISLHPEWQQKIIKIYENIGENNQLIFATHSPHIISSVKAEALKILVKGEKGIEFLEGENINSYIEYYNHFPTLIEFYKKEF